MTNRLEYRIQLKDAATGESIISAGGKVYVAVNGASAKVAITDKDNATLTNPMTPTRGFINFFTADTVEKVDLYIMAPGGQFLVRKDVKPSGPNEFPVDTARRHHAMVIPFSIDDTDAATETDTGFVVPSGAMMLPNPALDVLTIDATETIDVGTMGTSNDPNGFLAAASVATAGLVKGTLANGGVTMGALFFVQDSANAGDAAPEGNVSAQADEDPISYTLTAGTDTAEGFIHLPYYLAA